MNKSRDYNELFREHDQIVRLIPMLSEKQCDLVLRVLSKRLADIECALDNATGRSLYQILAEKKAQLSPQLNGTRLGNKSQS